MGAGEACNPVLERVRHGDDGDLGARRERTPYGLRWIDGDRERDVARVERGAKAERLLTRRLLEGPRVDLLTGEDRSSPRTARRPGPSTARHRVDTSTGATLTSSTMSGVILVIAGMSAAARTTEARGTWR